MIKALMILVGVLMYTKGECETNFFKGYKLFGKFPIMGKSNKIFKTLMGIPIGLLWLTTGHWLESLMLMGAVAIATQFSYGDDNWLTKLVGKGWAITITGCALGASFAPIIHWWAILSSIIGGVIFLVLHVLDDMNVIKEPFVAIGRGLVTLCILL